MPAPTIAALKSWVLGGGRLVLSAGAARSDEYNTSSTVLSDLAAIEQDEMPRQLLPMTAMRPWPAPALLPYAGCTQPPGYDPVFCSSAVIPVPGSADIVALWRNLVADFVNAEEAEDIVHRFGVLADQVFHEDDFDLPCWEQRKISLQVVVIPCAVDEEFSVLFMRQRFFNILESVGLRAGPVIEV